jgi:uncharacterized membrane protein YcaP (DUF421 family)
MELTAFQLELLSATRLNREFWAILENNGMVSVQTNRDRDAMVRKSPKHPGLYLVTVA